MILMDDIAQQPAVEWIKLLVERVEKYHQKRVIRQSEYYELDNLKSRKTKETPGYAEMIEVEKNSI